MRSRRAVGSTARRGGGRGRARGAGRLRRLRRGTGDAGARLDHEAVLEDQLAGGAGADEADDAACHLGVVGLAVAGDVERDAVAVAERRPERVVEGQQVGDVRAVAAVGRAEDALGLVDDRHRSDRRGGELARG